MFSITLKLQLVFLFSAKRTCEKLGKGSVPMHRKPRTKPIPITMTDDFSRYPFNRGTLTNTKGMKCPHIPPASLPGALPSSPSLAHRDKHIRTNLEKPSCGQKARIDNSAPNVARQTIPHASPLPQSSKLTTPEIKRRVRALTACAKEEGVHVARITLGYDGSVTIMDKSAVTSDDVADEASKYL